MLISNWIERLKATCPSLGNHVAGSVSLAVAQSESFRKPCAWVIYQGESAEVNFLMSGSMQKITAQVGVYLAVKNNTHPIGTGYTTEFETVHAEILSALSGWTPTGCITPVDYVSGKHQGFDNMTLYWYGVFETTYYLES